MNRNNNRLGLLVSLVFALAISGCKHPATSDEAKPMKTAIVASEAGKFCGWPANNGLWRWDGGREILVGFSLGDFVAQEGHNLKGGSDATVGVVSRLARSRDGGRSWTIEDPDNFVGDGGVATDSPGGFDFQSPDFALRVVCLGDLDGDRRLDLVGALIHNDGNLPKDKASVFWLEDNGGSPDSWKIHPIKWFDGANTRDPWIGEKWDYLIPLDVDADGDLDLLGHVEEHFHRRPDGKDVSWFSVVRFENPLN